MKIVSILIDLKNGTQDETSKLYKHKVVVCGDWKGHPKGPFKVTDDNLNTLLENFKASELDVVVDYEHATLYAFEAPAAGWIKELLLENGEIFAMIDWNSKALEQIDQKDYRYLSPVLDFHTVDQVSGEEIGLTLHSVALTNTPFLEELGELKANKFKQSEEEEMKPEEELKQKNESLEDENKKLKEQLQAQEDEKIESLVDNAIQKKQIKPENKQITIDMGKSNPANFEKFLEGLTLKPEKPADDLLDNSKKGKVPSETAEADLIKMAVDA